MLGQCRVHLMSCLVLTAAGMVVSISCGGSPPTSSPILSTVSPDRVTNLGSRSAILIQLNPVDGGASNLELLHRTAASLEIVTFPEAEVVATTRTTEIAPAAYGPGELYSIRPTAELGSRWYALHIPALGNEVMVATGYSYGARHADGSYMLRFRPDSFPVAREILFCRRDVVRVSLQLSEEVAIQDGEPPIVLTVNGEPLTCSLVQTPNVNGSPKSVSLDCPLFGESASVTASINPSFTSSSGSRIQNVGTTAAPRVFSFQTAGLPSPSGCSSYLID